MYNVNLKNVDTYFLVTNISMLQKVVKDQYCFVISLGLV